jgi:hypothetical protein
VEQKCVGFEIECFACGLPIKTLKKVEKHIKYECPKLKINCLFCGNWHSREAFKDYNIHPCAYEIDNILEKFSGHQ